VAHPPEDKWVGFMAILLPPKTGDMKEIRDMVRPEI
jgi:hypothetical protein